MNEKDVTLMLEKEGHRTISPEKLLSRTKGKQADQFDFLGFKESIGTYLADVKGLEELATYQTSGWNPDVGLLATYKIDSDRQAERNNNPNLSLIRVTRDYIYDKMKEYKEDLYRSFLVPPRTHGNPPEFCIEVPWTSRHDWIGPYEYEDIYGQREKWYGISPDHPSLIVHDWLDADSFPVTDVEVEYRDPIKLMKRMIKDLS